MKLIMSIRIIHFLVLIMSVHGCNNEIERQDNTFLNFDIETQTGSGPVKYGDESYVLIDTIENTINMEFHLSSNRVREFRFVKQEDMWIAELREKDEQETLVTVFVLKDKRFYCMSYYAEDSLVNHFDIAVDNNTGYEFDLWSMKIVSINDVKKLIGKSDSLINSIGKEQYYYDSYVTYKIKPGDKGSDCEIYRYSIELKSKDNLSGRAHFKANVLWYMLFEMIYWKP